MNPVRTVIDAPEITQTTAQLIAFIHLTIPRDQIQAVMGPGISELMSAVSSQGIAPTGPWFTHHLKMDPATFDFEIGVPGEFEAWIQATGPRSAPDLWEVYLAGPESGPDSAQWRTELVRALIG